MQRALEEVQAGRLHLLYTSITLALHQLYTSFTPASRGSPTTPPAPALPLLYT
jgi:hypothetical protein